MANNSPDSPDSGKALRDTLHQVKLFRQLTDEQLHWLSEYGSYIWLQPGDKVVTEGEPADYFFVLLEGELQLTKNVRSQEIYLHTYEPGTGFGEMSLLTGSPYYIASGHALKKSYLLRLEKETFWQMLTTFPSITRELLTPMAQRLQSLESTSQQQEKLIALGTLAAGLAHELNNPAAAISRGAKHLDETFQALSSRALKLNQCQMTRAQQAFVANLAQEVTERAAAASRLDPLTQSKQEDEVTDWLDAHYMVDGWKLASTLVGAGLDIGWLDTLAAQVPTDALGNVLTWLEAQLTAKELLHEIEQSSTRISMLVKAVKEYSYMDQAPLQEVDVHADLENTLVILDYKLKKGNIVVTREYDQSLPRFCAYGSELNQVWTNLIDNAIEAVDGAGHIWIRTFQEADRVVVEIADSGPGIPPDMQPRIFEPFFTTKDVGKGTGLGLDIVRRIVVGRHKGDIRVFSQPGNTYFQVRLPMNPAKTTQQQKETPLP